MNPSKLLLAGMLLALAGCGKAEPAKPSEVKPGEKQDAGPGPTPGPGSSDKGGPTPPAPPGPTLLAPTDPVQQAAERFITDLLKAATVTGPLPPDLMNRITPAFLKVIGKPLYAEADKKLGYSADQAQAWLRRAGAAMNGVGLPRGYGSPTAAVFVGNGIAGGPDRFLLRMIQAEGGWKIDWFELGTVKTGESKSTAPEGPYQDFAVLAFLDAITANASSKEDRALLLGGLLTPKLKNAWAEPFDADKATGFDFNKTKLALKLDEFGAGVTGFSRVAAGDTYKIELAKGEAKTSYTLKLIKGTTPGEWLVEEFTKQ
jgi:hypothetical protein